jgi:hypothetical protein
MPEDPKPEETKEQKKGKAPKAPLVKVRVTGSQPICEAGEVRQPKRQEPNGKGGLQEVPADVFKVTEERAEALGDSVELVG